MAIDFPAEINALRTTYASIREVSDLDALRRELADLNDEAAAPSLWDDPEHAQTVTSRLSAVQAELDRIEKMGSRIDDLEVLVELSEDEDDADSLAEAETELRPRSRSSWRSWRSAPCCRGSTTTARPSSRSAPRPAAWTPPTSPRC